MRRWVFGLLLVAGCRSCRGCDPELPDDTDDSDDTDTAPLVDSTSEPPCAVPEVEPNESPVQATPIALEQEGCGTFHQALDFDQWTFTVPEPTWIAVIVESTTVGSLADTNLILTTGTTAAEMQEWEGGQDVRLVIPVPAATFTALVTEAAALGEGDRYFYDLLVTEVKEPVDWTTIEPGTDNDAATGALDLVDGDAVLGASDAARDVDFYRIRVPAGGHVVTVDLDAFSYGSPGDFRLLLWDGTLHLEDTIEDGEQGFERDPYLTFDSPGDETWYVAVREEDDRGGFPYWYRLAVELKGDE